MIGRSRCSPASDGRFHDRLALMAELDGGRHAQHRVLRAEADQHQEADLEVDVVARARAAQLVISAPRMPNGTARHHRARQRPRLVLRGEHQEHDDEAEHERDHRRAAGLLLLVREPRPRERVARRQHFARDRLHRGDRVARAVARRGVAVDLGGGEAVEVRQEVGPGDPLRRDQRRERHHLARCSNACTGASGRSGSAGTCASDCTITHQTRLNWLNWLAVSEPNCAWIAL